MIKGWVSAPPTLILGAGMKHKTLPLVMLLMLVILTGCGGNGVDQEKLNSQIDVFGVKLFSSVDYKEINGVAATEEPCLNGYERKFDELNVMVGYGFDKKTRKITTLNENTGIFGIKPGSSFAEAKAKILKAGFKEYEAPSKFSAYGYSCTLLKDGDRVKGVMLEPLE